MKPREGWSQIDAIYCEYLITRGLADGLTVKEACMEGAPKLDRTWCSLARLWYSLVTPDRRAA